MADYNRSDAGQGVLFVVATPIGNLEDITLRALRVLQEVDLILAEDTRHTTRLLQHHGIDTPMLSLHEHNEQQRIEQVRARLEGGAKLALVSDAGTPLISDPGFVLVRALREEGLPVVPVPGPSALVAALSVSGLPTDRFHFEGFLPARSAARRKRLAALAACDETLVFYESCHRIVDSIDDMAEVLGAQRPAVVCRELTKQYEQVGSGTLASLGEWLLADDNHRRGEFVVVVGPEGRSPNDAEQVDEAALRTLRVLLEELPPRQAARLAARCHGLKPRVLYQAALDMKPAQ
ncbi:MAG: 16S rRNA (cytidine(1402)-2'-O)-methyltransferase [Gammaproteobacteria bacterium]|nr:MAG: 16S rRNA (cytidine(1402)-2'-O)-methyltransferase [Gammaproteobacteria bacterium]